MPIRSVELLGFKCWASREQLPLAPLTLLLGPNSVGKSTIGQAMRALAQSFDGTLPHRIVTRGPFVDLGSPPTVRAAGAEADHIGVGLGRYDDVGLTLAFHADWEGELVGLWMWMGQERWWWSADIDASSGEVCLIPAALGYRSLAVEGKQTRQVIDLLARDPDEPLEASDPVHFWARIRLSDARLVVDFQSDKPLDLQTQQLVDSQLTGADTDLTQTVSGALRGLLRSRIAMVAQEVECLYPIGPSRSVEVRFDRVDYLSRRPWVGLTGERMPQVLYEQPSCLERVNGWLEMLGIHYRMLLVEAGQTTRTVEPLLESTTPPLHRVGLPDVGFGIGQVLPLLVQMAILEEGMILVEQPETHLHPGMQARLVEVIVDWLGDPEEGERQILIETHSEHMVLHCATHWLTERSNPTTSE